MLIGGLSPVTFPRSFGATPFVTITPSDDDTRAATEYHGVIQISKTGFVANFGGTVHAKYFDWIAIGEAPLC